MSNEKDQNSELQIGMILGELRQALASNNAQSSRIEAQNVQILEQANDLGREITKLATDLVNVRSELSNRVDALEIRIAHRQPSPSVTNEVHSVHDSLRAVALETSQQTPAIHEIKSGVDELKNGVEVAVNGVGKTSKLTIVLLIILGVLNLADRIFEHYNAQDLIQAVPVLVAPQHQ